MGKVEAYLGVFVDDVLFVGKLPYWDATLEAINKRVPLKDLGQPEKFLGVDIRITDEATYLGTLSYVEKIVNKFGFSETPGKSTPAVHDHRLTKAAAPQVDVKEYQQKVGSILHASRWRSDIAYAAKECAKHLQNPTKEHMNAADRILKYLSSKKYWAFKCANPDKMDIKVMTDSDWGGDLDTRRSTSGFIVMVNDMVVVHTSQDQKSVSLSSAEAELYAISQGTRVLRFLRQIMTEMDLISSESSFEMFSDSQSALDICASEAGVSPAKHIDIRLKFIREQVENRASSRWPPTEVGRQSKSVRLYVGICSTCKDVLKPI